MAYRYRIVETQDSAGQPLWSIRAVDHAEDGTPISYTDGQAVVLALPGDGDPKESIRLQLKEQEAALGEPIVDGAGLPLV